MKYFQTNFVFATLMHTLTYLFVAAADSGTKDHQTQEEDKVAESENGYNLPVPGKHINKIINN